MKSIKKLGLLSLIITLSLFSVSAQPTTNGVKTTVKPGNYTKEQPIAGDPLNTHIYSLTNGLKVYISVNKDAPRIQTYIAVRAGSKNDPSDATGLAHYLEHMLFKGTDKLGTRDFAKEKKEIEKIENLYELYRKTTDEHKRKAIYREIDSISGVAAKYAIANEYDKLMTSIGAKGTNAHTWLEETVYQEDIPSNQIERWLTVEAERFRQPVLRLFHTELEAVYEEKNRGLDSDGNKAWEALFAGLFQKNTYGTQTTIGTIEHLKNPSLKKIKEYYTKYYIPNNMAICLAGDLDPEETIKLVSEKFGSYQRKPLPTYVPAKEEPITKPVVKEVFGPNAETLMLGYRFEGAGSKDADMLMLINKILANGKAGLMDLNLNQSQKVLNSSAFELIQKDYSAHIFSADPKQGQTLEQLRDLLLEQLEKVKQGDFPDWLLGAVINDLKLQKIKEYETNVGRATALYQVFISGQPWDYYVNTIDRLSKITKQQVIDFAKANYTNTNYVIVYKRTGEDKNVQKVVKPAITPVEVNRNEQSEFLKKFSTSSVKPIEPVFIDYKNDIKIVTLKNNIPLLYAENKENKTFDLYYVLEMGTNNDKRLGVAVDYLKYLGTSKYTNTQLQQEFYKIGCTYNVFSAEDQIYVSLSGLAENFDKGLNLFEELLSDAQPNEEVLKNLVGDILKARKDAKLNKNIILFSAMYNYGIYGPKSPYTNILSEDELNKLQPQELIAIIKNLSSYEHKVVYYGTEQVDPLVSKLNKAHKIPTNLTPVPALVVFPEQPTVSNVYVIDYDMKQAEIIMLSKDEPYNKSIVPSASLFNEYFGSGMGSIVFQDMRESKALAYSVFSSYRIANRLNRSNYVLSYIGTQADKLPEAMAGMFNLMNNMPEAETSFMAAKEAVLQGIRTERIIKSDLLFNYLRAMRLNLDYDIRKDVFMKVPNMTMADIKAFQTQRFKDKGFTYLVLGKKENLDLKTLEKYGKVTFLKLEDVFGY